MIRRGAGEVVGDRDVFGVSAALAGQRSNVSPPGGNVTALIDAGILDEDEPVELLEGVITPLSSSTTR